MPGRGMAGAKVQRWATWPAQHPSPGDQHDWSYVSEGGAVREEAEARLCRSSSARGRHWSWILGGLGTTGGLLKNKIIC